MNLEATIGPENRGPGESGGNGRPPRSGGGFFSPSTVVPILVARGSLQSWCDYKVPQTLEGYWGFQVVGMAKGVFQDFRPPKIINICWKRGLGPRALNLAFPKTPRVLSGAMEDRIEAFFEHFPSGPGQLLAGQSSAALAAASAGASSAAFDPGGMLSMHAKPKASWSSLRMPLSA